MRVLVEDERNMLHGSSVGCVMRIEVDSYFTFVVPHGVADRLIKSGQWDQVPCQAMREELERDIKVSEVAIDNEVYRGRFASCHFQVSEEMLIENPRVQFFFVAGDDDIFDDWDVRQIAVEKGDPEMWEIYREYSLKALARHLDYCEDRYEFEEQKGGEA